ncbi:unnamed protein product [Brassica oleracea var. botrytis]|uniref:Uncharacterized protein n=1 Tax=Brassica oleracea TaxID=3712 RepID=A0A3P6EPL0_BRAOL|nr:unnamed protein product [Brassica oleracea]
MIAYRVQKSLEKNIQSHRSCLCVLEGNELTKHVLKQWSTIPNTFCAGLAELTDKDRACGD